MNLSGVFQTWLKILTSPGEAVFEEAQEHPNATLQSAVIWVIIATAISAVFRVISSITNNLVLIQFRDRIERELIAIEPFLAAGVGQSFEFSPLNLAISFCLWLFILPIAFFIGTVIYFAIAKLLGGTGDFEGHTFLLAAISAPMSIVISIVRVVPLLGLCLGFLLWVYQLVLTYNAMKVSHDLTPGRAILVTLGPLIIFLLLLCCVIALIGGLVGAITSGQI